MFFRQDINFFLFSGKLNFLGCGGTVFSSPVNLDGD
jgi:hypothetical protein